MYVLDVILVSTVFFFKQKTAYEMRISDWSSDVCSSDLIDIPIFAITSSVATQRKVALYRNVRTLGVVPSNDSEVVLRATEGLLLEKGIEIGRASCRERVCQYV